MTLRAMALTLAITFLGCEDRDAKPAGPALECGPIVTRMLASIGEPKTSAQRKLLALLERSWTTHCQDDQWSQAALGCFAAARTRVEQRACQKKHLTEEQVDNIEAQLGKLAVAHRREQLATMTQGMSQIRDAMCACTDAACADRTHAELEAYGKTLEPLAFEDWAPKTGLDAERARLKDVADEIVACSTRASKVR